jgi:hypothetical protein
MCALGCASARAPAPSGRVACELRAAPAPFPRAGALPSLTGDNSCPPLPRRARMRPGRPHGGAGAAARRLRARLSRAPDGCRGAARALPPLLARRAPSNRQGAQPAGAGGPGGRGRGRPAAGAARGARGRRATAMSPGRQGAGWSGGLWMRGLAGGTGSCRAEGVIRGLTVRCVRVGHAGCRRAARSRPRRVPARRRRR